ncbi:hypothetical protein BRD11_05710 [Halobacteriales archaeon SW_12_69_24]|nr:MAG: hypothetical protein BRD11_05710 [Halobacteriales archaeon SW_12_69_24]
MSLRTVVEDDLLRLRRSPLGWGVALTVMAVTAGIGMIVLLFEIIDVSGDPASFDNIMMTVGVLLSFLLPFLAMLGSYSAIVHERDSGSIRFLLGLPNSRLDAYAGKYVSRTVLLSGSILAGFVVLGAIGFAILTEPDASGWLLFLLAPAEFESPESSCWPRPRSPWCSSGSASPSPGSRTRSSARPPGSSVPTSSSAAGG